MCCLATLGDLKIVAIKIYNYEKFNSITTRPYFSYQR